jgi:hypothetical protein
MTPKASLAFAETILSVDPYPPSPRYTLFVLQEYSRRIERKSLFVEDDTFANLLFSTLQLTRGTTEGGTAGAKDGRSAATTVYFIALTLYLTTFCLSLCSSPLPAPVADPDLLQYLTFRIGSGVLAVRTGPFHNDVGLRMWEAGYFLAEFLVKNPHLVADKSVIELGSGVGLTGLVIQGKIGRDGWSGATAAYRIPL